MNPFLTPIIKWIKSFYVFLKFFKINFCWIHVHFWDHWYPCFRHSGESFFDTHYQVNKELAFFLIFKINFCWTHIHFWGHWYPCLRLLVTPSLGFEARVGILICAWQRCTWYTFPEIHLWCDTFASVYGQHSN